MMRDEKLEAGTNISGVAKLQAPSRCDLLIGGAAVLVLAAEITLSASAYPVSPDAELIGPCADLDAMGMRIGVLFDFQPSGPTDPRPEAADAAAQLIEARQRRVPDRICALAPAALADRQAPAQLLALPCSGPVHAPAGADVEARLISTLLRGLREGA